MSSIKIRLRSIEMKKFIKLNKDNLLWVAKTLGVSKRMVEYALTFDAKRGQSKNAEKIRKLAMERGGRLMVEALAFETIHDANGFMHHLFDNGAEVVVDKQTARVEVKDRKGVVVRSVENCSIPQLYMEQIFAASL